MCGARRRPCPHRLPTLIPTPAQWLRGNFGGVTDDITPDGRYMVALQSATRVAGSGEIATSPLDIWSAPALGCPRSRYPPHDHLAARRATNNLRPSHEYDVPDEIDQYL